LSHARDEQPPTPRRTDRRVDRWREIRSAIGLTQQAVRRAQLQLLVFAPLFAGVILIWDYRDALFGLDTICHGGVPRHQVPCSASDRTGTTILQVFVVIALVLLGWQLARDFGRAISPMLFRRMDAATAGTTGFLIRLVALVLALVVALRLADISITAIAIGASASAVVIGLAAQQTLGNLIAGIVILSARPFRVGDTVRLQAGALGGRIEGVVTSVGLMYTTFDAGGDPVLVPNSAVIAAASSPLREPEAVTLRARLRSGVTPVELQRAIEEQLTIPIRRHPRVVLEEVDGSDVVVTITVTPRNTPDGGRLASELLDVVTREIGSESEDGRDPAADQVETT
jgi:small conductance mechanosensitive channel